MPIAESGATISPRHLPLASASPASANLRQPHTTPRRIWSPVPKPPTSTARPRPSPRPSAKAPPPLPARPRPPRARGRGLWGAGSPRSRKVSSLRYPLPVDTLHARIKILSEFFYFLTQRTSPVFFGLIFITALRRIKPFAWMHSPKELTL